MNKFRVVLIIYNKDETKIRAEHAYFRDLNELMYELYYFYDCHVLSTEKYPNFKINIGEKMHHFRLITMFKVSPNDYNNKWIVIDDNVVQRNILLK